MYEIWSCVTFHHSLNRFSQPNDICLYKNHNIFQTTRFNCRSLKTKKNDLNPSKKLFSMFEILFFLWYYFEIVGFLSLTLLYLFSLLKCHGDIELNPGPRKSKNNSLSVSLESQ